MVDVRCWQTNLQHSKTASATLVADLENAGKPCLVLIQEPHVFKNVIRNLFSKNYSILSGGKHPRAAILIPKALNVTTVEALSDDDFTCCTIDTQINSNHLSKILVISGYLDITFNPHTSVEKLQRIFDFANTNSLQILMGLDSNAWSSLWGCSETNRRGEVLEEFILRNDAFILNTGSKPTFVTSRAKSIIDITLITNDLLNLVNDWKVEDEDTFSDHKRISFELKLACPDRVKARSIENTDWKLFNKILEGIKVPNLSHWTEKELDKIVNQFNKTVKYALEKACPEREVLLFKRKQPAWWNEEISSARRKVRKKYQKARRTMLEEDWDDYRSKRSSYNKLIKTSKTQMWRSFTSEISSPKGLARLVKNLQGSKLPQAGLFRGPDGEAATNMEDSIQNAFDVMFPGNLEVSKGPEGTRTCSLIQMETEADFITEEKIKLSINSFSPNKSPGPDGIKPIMLKNLGGKSIKLLKTLFRASLTLKYVPEAWREATVALIPKPNKGQYDLPKSFRPISLTSFVFKTLERVVLWQIEDTVLIKRPLNKHQHAYVRGRSCDTALSELVDRLEQGVHRGNFSLGVFLDIQGAFDYVDPAKAVEAMNRRGTNPFIVKWYGHYLRSRTATMKINDTQVTRTLPRGLPQGGIISPVAWDLVVDNLLVHLNKETNVLAVGYADDVAIVTVGLDPNTLVDIVQCSIEKACKWGRANGLNFNASKTEAVFFTRKRKLPSFKPITVNGTKVDYSDGCKYLGVYIDSKLTWKHHIQTKIDKCKKLLYLIKATVGRKWGINPQLVRWAYTGIVRPTLAFACHIWWNFTPSKTTITQLTRLSRLACLSIAKVHRSTPTKGLEVIYNLPPLEFFLAEQTLSAFRRTKKLVKSNWTNPGGLSGHLGRIQKVFDKLKIPHLVEERRVIRVWNKLFGVNLDFENTRDDSHESNNTTYVYTDGSKIHDNSGFGYVVRKKHKDPLSHSGYLGADASVFQAEIEAVLVAAEHLGRSYRNSRITFRIDSQAAVRALSNPIVKTDQVMRCIGALQKLGNHNKVTITWIKAHVGHYGNELADEAAKAGAMLKLQGPGPFIELTEATPKTIIKDYANRLWSKQWSKSVEYLHTKKFYPAPSNKMSKLLGKLSRENVSLLVQVITGHCSLLYHSRHYSATPEEEDTLCRLCLEEDEKPWHLLTDCPALNGRREAHFGWILVLTNTVPWSPTRLLTFFREHSIQQLFDQVQ